MIINNDAWMGGQQWRVSECVCVFVCTFVASGVVLIGFFRRSIDGQPSVSMKIM